MKNSDTMKQLKSIIENGNKVDPDVRDIMILSALVDVYDQLDTLEQALRASTDRLQIVYTFYRAGLWFASAIGISMIGIIFALITGQLVITHPGP